MYFAQQPSYFEFYEKNLTDFITHTQTTTKHKHTVGTCYENSCQVHYKDKLEKNRWWRQLCQ